MTGANRPQEGSIDPSEVSKFDVMAAEWWDPEGKFKPLHWMNPTRLDYIASQIAAEFDRDRATRAPFEGLTLIDVGCGGGLLCEPMARLGAQVTGIDAAEASIPVARAHAAQGGLEIAYRHAAAEEVLAGHARFHVVLAMEIVEHVADQAAFLKTCAALLRPGGLLLCSTLNRTPRAYMLAIVGAERVMRWLPAGTHQWRKFVTPEELDAMMRAANLEPVDRKGVVFNPLTGAWSLSADDLSVNYVAAAVKPG